MEIEDTREEVKKIMGVSTEGRGELFEGKWDPREALLWMWLCLPKRGRPTQHAYSGFQNEAAHCANLSVHAG